MYTESLIGEKHSNRDPHLSDDLDDFTDAEYIIPKDEVVVDIDHLREGDIDRRYDIADFIYENIIQTKTVISDNGIHLYFKRGNKKYSKSGLCNLGLIVEYKQHKVTVKRNGVAREVYKSVSGEYPNIPKYFNKIAPDNDKFNMLWNGEGTKRRDTLFSFIQRCQKGLDYDLIAHFVNDYVFLEPTSENNLNTIERLDSVEVDKKYQQLVDILDYINENRNKIHLYQGTIYIKNEENRWVSSEEEVNYFLGTDYKNGFAYESEKQELIKQIRGKFKMTKLQDHNVIQFKNGFIENGKIFKDIEFDEFTPFCFDMEYTEEFESPILDKYFDIVTSGNKEVEEYLISIVALSLIFDKNIRKKYSLINVIIGDGGNGKGLFLDLIKGIFPDNLISSVTPDQHSDNSHQFNMVNSIINIGDDIDKKSLRGTSLALVKQVSAREKISVRDMYSKGVSIIPSTLLLYTANEIPQFTEGGNSISRRFRYINFKENVTEMLENGDLDDEFIASLTDEATLQVFFNKVIKRCVEIQKTRHINIPTAVTKFTKKTLTENDFFLSWYEDNDIDSLLHNEPPSSMIFDEYKEHILKEFSYETKESQQNFNKKLGQKVSKKFEKTKVGGTSVWKRIEHD